MTTMGAVVAGNHTGTLAARTLLLVGIFLLLGATAVMQPVVAVALILLTYVALRGEHVIKDGVTALLLGNIVLTYGFANIGLNLGAIPVPMTELMLLPLVGLCFLRIEYLRSMGVTAAFLLAFVGVAFLRLIIDFPTYGSLAVRDFATPLEALTLFTSYWAFNRYGLRWALGLWKPVLLIVIAYSLLFPWQFQLAGMGPVVGLQRPVPLLGQYQGSGPAVAAAFFFCLLLMRPPSSLLLGAMALGCIAFFQLRGLYLALPMAFCLILLASGQIRSRLTSRIVGTVTVATLALALVTPLGLQGRMGNISLSFFAEQLGTLVGQQGEGTGSYEDRLTWLELNWQDLTSGPDTLIFGVGLGPDLTGGFAAGGEILIRKPHNDWLEVLVRLGLVGFLAWLAFLASIFLSIWRGVRSSLISATEKSFLLWVVAASVCYLVIAATQPLLAFPYGTVPLFMMLGMGLALSKQIERRASEPEEAPE